MGAKPMASLTLEVDGEVREGMASGDGAVDATFAAIRQAWPHDVALKLYAVQSVTGGTDAQARVTVRLEENGKIVDGQGRRHRHHRGVGEGLRAQPQQAAGEAAADRAGGVRRGGGRFGGLTDGDRTRRSHFERLGPILFDELQQLVRHGFLGHAVVELVETALEPDVEGFRRCPSSPSRGRCRRAGCPAEPPGLRISHGSRRPGRGGRRLLDR